MILRKNYRFEDDPDLEDMLERMPVGQPTAADLRAFNSRCVQEIAHNLSSPLHEDEGVVIVPQNCMREKINSRQYFRKVCSAAGPRGTDWRSRGVLRIDTIVSHRSTGRGRNRRVGARMTAEYTKIGKYLTEEMLGDQDGGRPVTGFMCIGGRYNDKKCARVERHCKLGLGATCGCDLDRGCSCALE